MALITSATARTLAARSWEVRRQVADDLRKAANPVPLPADNSYVQARLARVRNQIERLSDMLDTEEEPQKIDRLASAIERLHKAEFALANRPMPGPRKPAPERTEHSHGAWLSEPAPTPAPSSAVHTPTPSVPIASITDSQAQEPKPLT